MIDDQPSEEEQARARKADMLARKQELQENAHRGRAAHHPDFRHDWQIADDATAQEAVDKLDV